MRPTDRFENWFITSLQTGINDTTSSFRLDNNLNVHECRLVIDPYDESIREVVKVTSVDGNLVYVERGDDNTSPQYHLKGAIVALNVVAADMNDLYADFAGVVDATDAANIAASDASAAASDASQAATDANNATSAATTATGNANAATTAANDAASDANSAASSANTAASNAQTAADNAQGIVDDVAGAVASNIQPIQINGAKTAVGIGKAPTDGALDVDGDIYSNGEKVQTIDDTGWLPLPLNNDWRAYSSSDSPVYRIRNGVVELRGAIQPKSNTTSGYFAALPVEAWHSHSTRLVYVCQGSGSNVWSMSIQVDGGLLAERYQGGTMGTSNWFPFAVTYMID